MVNLKTRRWRLAGISSFKAFLTSASMLVVLGGWALLSATDQSLNSSASATNPFASANLSPETSRTLPQPPQTFTQPGNFNSLSNQVQPRLRTRSSR